MLKIRKCLTCSKWLVSNDALCPSCEMVLKLASQLSKKDADEQQKTAHQSQQRVVRLED